jgi:hypothetical protein
MAATDDHAELMALQTDSSDDTGSADASADAADIQHDVGAKTDGTSSSPPPLPRRRYQGLMPRPNCTHIIMDYFYTTEVPCDLCRCPPCLGWLYVCQQDHYSESMARHQMESLDQISDKQQVPNRIEELQACGMSRSILDQIRQGNVYDPFQIEVSYFILHVPCYGVL